MNKYAKALLVEDHEFVQLAVKCNLQDAGCEVDVASSGEQALELARKKSYDIIFMDLGLSDSDGFYVTREIKKSSKNQESPIVALTANNEQLYKTKAKEVGMKEFVLKPLGISRAKNIIERLVHNNLNKHNLTQKVKEA